MPDNQSSAMRIPIVVPITALSGKPTFDECAAAIPGATPWDWNETPLPAKIWCPHPEHDDEASGNPSFAIADDRKNGSCWSCVRANRKQPQTNRSMNYV